MYEILQIIARLRATSKWGYWFVKEKYVEMVVDMIRARRDHVIGWVRPFLRSVSRCSCAALLLAEFPSEFSKRMYVPSDHVGLG